MGSTSLVTLYDPFSTGNSFELFNPSSGQYNLLEHPAFIAWFLKTIKIIKEWEIKTNPCKSANIICSE